MSCLARLRDGVPVRAARASRVDDIRARLAEIRVRVIGLAMAPPVAKDNKFCRTGVIGMDRSPVAGCFIRGIPSAWNTSIIGGIIRDSPLKLN